MLILGIGQSPKREGQGDEMAAICLQDWASITVHLHGDMDVDSFRILTCHLHSPRPRWVVERGHETSAVMMNW